MHRHTAECVYVFGVSYAKKILGFCAFFIEICPWNSNWFGRNIVAVLSEELHLELTVSQVTNYWTTFWQVTDMLPQITVFNKISRQMSMSILVQRQWAFITFIDWKAMSIYIWNSLKLLWRWLPYWKYLLTGIMALTFLTPQLTSFCAPQVIGPSIKFNYFLKWLL